MTRDGVGRMTFVLVHGGNVAASSWDRLVPLLDLEVLAVDLPGRGVRAAMDVGAASLADLAEAIVEDVVAADVRAAVVVGHSVGGMLLPYVVRRVPERVARLVYVSAVVPPHGTSVLDHLDPEVRTVVGATVEDGRQRPVAEQIVPFMCSDLAEADRALVGRSLVDEAAALLLEPVDLSGIEGVESTYVLLRQDRANPLERQREAIDALGRPDEVQIDAGHMVMMSRPEALAAVLHAVAARPAGVS